MCIHIYSYTHVRTYIHTQTCSHSPPPPPPPPPPYRFTKGCQRFGCTNAKGGVQMMAQSIHRCRRAVPRAHKLAEHAARSALSANPPHSHVCVCVCVGVCVVCVSLAISLSLAQHCRRMRRTPTCAHACAHSHVCARVRARVCVLWCACVCVSTDTRTRRRAHLRTPPDPLAIIDSCSLTGVCISEKHFTYRSLQIFKILFQGFHAAGSDPPHKIMRYWFFPQHY